MNNDIDLSLVEILRPVAHHVVQQFIKVFCLNDFEKYDFNDIPEGTLTNPVLLLNDFILWSSNQGGRELKGLLRSKKIFPELDLSPILPMALHFKSECNIFIEIYPFFKNHLEEHTIVFDNIINSL